MASQSSRLVQQISGWGPTHLSQPSKSQLWVCVPSGGGSGGRRVFSFFPTPPTASSAIFRNRSDQETADSVSGFTSDGVNGEYFYGIRAGFADATDESLRNLPCKIVRIFVCLHGALFCDNLTRFHVNERYFYCRDVIPF